MRPESTAAILTELRRHVHAIDLVLKDAIEREKKRQGKVLEQFADGAQTIRIENMMRGKS